MSACRLRHHLRRARPPPAPSSPPTRSTLLATCFLPKLRGFVGSYLTSEGGVLLASISRPEAGRAPDQKHLPGRRDIMHPEPLRPRCDRKKAPRERARKPLLGRHDLGEMAHQRLSR